MKVILKRNVDKLGQAGDVVDVADGYGNNYLMPRGLAMRATNGAMRDAEAMRQARIKREERSQAEAQETRSRLESSTVTIRAKAGEDGTLYGSVSNRDVAAAIAEQLGVKIDRKRMPMERPLKRTGYHTVNVKLHPEVSADVAVEVVPGE